MAGQIPDPRSLNSWEDAFQHPLPVVRKLEQQLRKNIDENRQKLRSLVGTSYRDLLGTAERIIEMDQQMETVETHLGEIGRKCNTRTMERIADNHAQMRKSSEAREGGGRKAMAQAKVLQSALTMVSRVIKTGGDALQASKLLVLSRLVHKSVSESAEAPGALEGLRLKLATLRKKLLSYIGRSLARPVAEKTLQAHSLCAYALITSSTPKEVLRYFLQVRYEQLESQLDSPSEVDVLQMLEVYSQTILDARDLFPRRFADSLSQLTKRPLIQDEQIKSLFELNLDVYGFWISDDVRSFTPWIRNEQTTTVEVADAVASWADHAQNCILRGVQERLGDQNDAPAVIELRQKVVSKYMSLNSRLRNDSHAQAIHKLRGMFVEKLMQLAAESAQVSKFVLNDAELSSLVEPSAERRSLWDSAAQDLDLNQGALKFRQSIIRNRHGRNAAIQSQTAKLDAWVTRVHSYLDLIDEMRTAKWDAEYDFDLDDLGDSDILVKALNKDDPQRVQDKLQLATSDTLIDIITNIQSAAESTQNAAHHLRICREIEQRRRSFGSRLSIDAGEISLTSLCRNIAQTASKDALEEYIGAAKSLSRPAVALWDNGSPPLPIQVSPPTARFLSNLQRAMANAGTDLWSPECVLQLKRVVSESLAAGLGDDGESPFLRLSYANDAVTLTNGHVETNDDDTAETDGETLANGTDVAVKKDLGRERLLQNLFDVLYLCCIFNHADADVAMDLTKVVQRLKGELELADGDVVAERLKKSASEYWKRTYLLFGLLAS